MSVIACCASAHVRCSYPALVLCRLGKTAAQVNRCVYSAFRPLPKAYARAPSGGSSTLARHSLLARARTGGSLPLPRRAAPVRRRAVQLARAHSHALCWPRVFNVPGCWRPCVVSQQLPRAKFICLLTGGVSWPAEHRTCLRLASTLLTRCHGPSLRHHRRNHTSTS